MMKRQQPAGTGKNSSNANEPIVSEEYFEACNRFQGNFALRNGQTSTSDDGSFIQAIVQGETAPSPDVHKSRYRITLDYAYDPADKALALDDSVLEELIRILRPSADSIENLSQADLLEGLKPVLHSLLSHFVSRSQSLEAERGFRPIPKPRSSTSSIRLHVNRTVETNEQADEQEAERVDPDEDLKERQSPEEAAKTVTAEVMAESQERLQGSDQMPAEELEASPEDDQLYAEPMIGDQENLPFSDSVPVEKPEASPEDDQLDAEPVVEGQEYLPFSDPALAKKPEDSPDNDQLDAEPMVGDQENLPFLDSVPVNKPRASPEDDQLDAEPVVEGQEYLPSSDPALAEKPEASPDNDQLDAEPSPGAVDYQNPASDYQSGETNVAENESLKTAQSKSQPSERSIPEHSLANSVQDPKLAQALVATLSVSTTSSVQRIEPSELVVNASLTEEAPIGNGSEIELQAPQYYSIEVAVDGPVLTDPEQIGESSGASVIEGIKITAVDELGHETNIASVISTDGKEIVVESVIDLSSSPVVTQESVPYSEANRDFVPSQDLPEESVTNTKITEDGNGQESLNDNLLVPRDSPLHVLQIDAYDANEVVSQGPLETADQPTEVLGAVIQEVEDLPERPIPEIVLDTQQVNELEEADSKLVKISKKVTKRPDSRSRGSCEHSVIGIRASVDGSVLKLTQESEVCPGDNSEDGGTEMTYNLDVLISWPKKRKGSDSGGQLDLRVGVPGAEMKVASDGKSFEVSSSHSKTKELAESDNEALPGAEYEKNDQNGSCSIPDGYTMEEMPDIHTSERLLFPNFWLLKSSQTLPRLSHQIGRFLVSTYRPGIHVHHIEQAACLTTIRQSPFGGLADLKPTLICLSNVEEILLFRHAFYVSKGVPEVLQDFYRKWIKAKNQGASFELHLTMRFGNEEDESHCGLAPKLSGLPEQLSSGPANSARMSTIRSRVRRVLLEMPSTINGFGSSNGKHLGVLDSFKGLITASSFTTPKALLRQGSLSHKHIGYSLQERVSKRVSFCKFILAPESETALVEQQSRQSSRYRIPIALLTPSLYELFWPPRRPRRLAKAPAIMSASHAINGPHRHKRRRSTKPGVTKGLASGEQSLCLNELYFPEDFYF